MWCNFTLTDAAMHEGGPHSEMAAASVRDSDGRLGEVLDALEQRGRVRRHRVRARRRPRHGGERSRRAAATGTSPCARPASRPATRRTASCISASDRASVRDAPGSIDVQRLGRAGRAWSSRRRVLLGATAAATARTTPTSGGDDHRRPPASDADFAKLFDDARRSSRSRSRTPTRAATTHDLRPGRRRATRVYRDGDVAGRSRRRAATVTCENRRRRHECDLHPTPITDGRRQPLHRDCHRRTKTYATALDYAFATHDVEDASPAATPTASRSRPTTSKASAASPAPSGRRVEGLARRYCVDDETGVLLENSDDRRDGDTTHRQLHRDEVRGAVGLRLRAARRRPTVVTSTAAGVRAADASTRSVADVPEAEATRRGELARARRGRRRASTRHASRRAGACPRRPRRACRRSRAPSASRTRWRGSRSAARRRLRRPSATRTRGASSDEPSGPLRQNDAKSCSPTNGSAASRSARRSSGSGTHHANRSRNGSGTGRLRIV